MKYQSGFGNAFESEVKEGTLPKSQNSPIKLKYGVYAEQLSGTAFTVKRSENQKTWLYKVRPSAVQGQYSPSKREFKIVADFNNNEHIEFHPNQLRWKPIPSVEEGKKTNFI